MVFCVPGALFRCPRCSTPAGFRRLRPGRLGVGGHRDLGPRPLLGRAVLGAACLERASPDVEQGPLGLDPGPAAVASMVVSVIGASTLDGVGSVASGMRRSGAFRPSEIVVGIVLPWQPRRSTAGWPAPSVALRHAPTRAGVGMEPRLVERKEGD